MNFEEFQVILCDFLNELRIYVNASLDGLEPWQILSFTFGFTVFFVSFLNFLFPENEDFIPRVKKTVFRIARKIPMVKKKIKEESDKTMKSMCESFNKSGFDYVTDLPKTGLSLARIREEIKKYKSLGDLTYMDGYCSGTLYNVDTNISKLISEVYTEFAWTNPLHADVFPYIRKMEAEVVRMACNIFNGSDESCGTMTTGGTESIMLACKAYRDLAYERGVRYPEMVIPITAHAAFLKSCQSFKIKPILIPINKQTRQVDVIQMRKAISKRTCMLVGSAPEFSYGIIDDIESISKLAVKYKLPLHVDSCLGGFLIPFSKKAGYELPPFDFSLPGVTSISADTHKYGYAPKGSSVILYKNSTYRSYQYFASPDWPGGIYATPTFAGSRAGGIIAACWATLMYVGEEGYVSNTKKILETRQKIEDEVRNIKGLFVYGKPRASVVSFGSDDFNIYSLYDAMTKRKWALNALQFPSSVHICLTMAHVKSEVVELFLKDLRECTAEILENPQLQTGGQAAVYGLAQSIPDRSIIGDMAGIFFDAYYSTSTK